MKIVALEHDGLFHVVRIATISLVLGPVYCFSVNSGFKCCRGRAVGKPDRIINIKLRRPIEIGTSISPTIPGTAPRILDPSIVTPNNLCCFPQPDVSFVELTSLYFVQFGSGHSLEIVHSATASQPN